MGRTGSTLPFLLVAALAHHAIASKCNAGCVGSNGNVFNYEPGTVYKYELEGTSVMTLSGADSDVSKLTVKATADVGALPNCGFSVTLTSYQATDKDGKTTQGEKGQPVVFSMNNGVVQTDICSSKDEPADPLNIKRAIISLLQSSPDTVSKTEVDIFGSCPTETNVHKSGSKLKVKKFKNLSNCAHRQNLLIPFTTTHYHSVSDLQSIPWISATQKVEQDVEGQVKWAMSKEEYVMPPATGAEAGATVSITTKLSLQGTGGGAAEPAGIDKERTILLKVKEVFGENNLKTTSEILKKICEGAQNEMDKDNANLFAYLTYLLGKSNKATMTSLFNQIKQGQICANKDTAKKVLFDAIFDSQSADGVQAMAELLKNKEVTGIKAQMWYAALGNVKHATIPSLKSVANMIDSDSPIEAYLGAGSLLGRYCRTHTCEGVPEANQLQKKLSGPLTKGCKPASIAEEDKLLASIKGIGNSNYLSGPVTKQLIQCANDRTVRSRVRSAALDALRADPNKEVIKKTAITILKDKTEDSELRIKAYLIITECPCGKMAAIIKEVLEKEETFQVGNFIVSHLRNIRASKNPDKAKAQAHFSGILTSKSYPFDIRKYSTNFETSYMLDSLNLGGSVESNLLYSQKSWIPRSVNLNLTSQLFGNNLNVLELDVRAENLEKMIERVLGPRGYLESKQPEDIGEDVNGFFTNLKQKAQNTFRPKRGVSQNDIDAIANQVNLGVDFQGEKDESLDLSVKMFGSEIAWIPLHGANLDQTPTESVNNAFNIIDSILDKTKNIDIDYTKHKVLAEGVVAYPTALGVPLKIKGVVSTAMRVKLDGKIDIPAIMRDPHNALIKFQVIPSGVISASLITMMEAADLNTGFKVTATAHSSTGSDVSVRILEGSGIDVKFGLPLAKQEVTLKTDINSFSNSALGKSMTPVTFNTKREEYSGCFDQISELLGLTFCGEVSTPWDGSRVISPAYGPTSITARIEKDDPSLSNFHFKAFLKLQKDAPQHHLEIIFDTPNSKKERRLGITIENTVQPNLIFKAHAESPFGNAKVETSLIDTEAEKSVNAEFVMVDHEWVFKAGLKQSGPNKYKPFLEYKIPEEPKQRFSAISGNKPEQNFVAVSGDIELQGNKLIFQGVKLTVSRKDYILDGSIWNERSASGADMQITAVDDVFTLKAETKYAPHHTKRTFMVASKNFPDATISASWDLEHHQTKKQTKVKSDLFVIHGADQSNEMAKVSLTNSYLCVRNQNNMPIKIDAKNSLKYPIMSIEGKLDFHGDSEALGYDIKAAFDEYKAGSSLEVLLAPEYILDFGTKFMENEMIAHMKREKAGDHKFKYTNSIEVNPGGKYQFDFLVTHKFEPEDTDAHIEAKITLPADPKEIEIKAGILENSKVSKGLIWASVDGKNLIDGKFNFQKGEETDGTYNLVLSEYVDSNGKLKFGPSGVDGNFVINLLKPNKKIEGKTHIVDNGHQVKGTGDLCLDGKCIKLSTDTTIQQDSFDTKNNLELPAGLTIGVNVKGDEPKGSHSADIELKAPNGHQTKVTYSSVRHIRPADSDVEYIAGLEDVSGPGAKPLRLEIKLVGKHIDLDKQTGDGQVVVNYHTPEDKDLSGHINYKRVLNGDTFACHSEVGVSGSLIHQPATLIMDAELSEKYFDGHYEEDGSIPPANYQFKFDMGDEVSIESHGKGSGHTVSNELNINLPKANTGIKHFKWSTNNMVDLYSDNSKIKTSNTVKWDGKFITTNLEVNEEVTGVNFNMDIEGDSLPKKSLTGSGHFCDMKEDGVCKTDGALTLQWDGKKADISIKSEVDHLKKIGHVDVKGTALDGTNFEISSKAKCNNKGDQDVAFHGETTAVIGGKKWQGTGTVEIDNTKSNINFVLDQPEGQSQFKSLSVKKGEMHYLSEFAVKWISNGGGKMEGDMEFNVQDENNFSIVYNLDSPVLNLNKFYFEAKITPDQKLALDLKNNGKTLAAAKASYQLTADGYNRKIEGSGNINVEGTDYPLTYDATFHAKPEMRSLLGMTINAKAGDRTLKFKSDGKPNNFHLKRTYCKAADQCSEAEIVYENKITDAMNYEQNFLYKMDFSLFNPQLNDVKIASKAKAEGFNYNYNLDFDWGESKVNYVSFLQSNKAGVSLALPQRTMAAEASIGVPKKDKNAVKIEGSVWLDKTKAPNKRTHLVIIGEVGQKDDLYTALGEIKFNNPALPKPLVVKGKTSISTSYTKPSGEGAFEIDVFKKPKMKIVGNWKMSGQETKNGFQGTSILKMKSEELKINMLFEQKASILLDEYSANYFEKVVYTNAKGQNTEAISKIELTPKKLYITSKLGDTTLLDYLAKWDITEYTLDATEELEYYNSKYSDHFQVQLKPYLKADYKFINNKGCDNKAFTWAAIFEMGKTTKLDVGFGGKTILSGEVSLAPGSFLKPEASYDKNAVADLKDCYERSVHYADTEIQQVVYKLAQDTEDELKAKAMLLQDAKIDWEEVAKIYEGEFEKIQDEILADKNVQGIIALVRESLNVFFENAAETIESFQGTHKKFSEEMNKAVNDLMHTIEELRESLKVSSAELMKATSNLVKDLQTSLTSLVDSIIKEISAHSEDIDAIFRSIGEVVEEYGQIIHKYIQQISEVCETYFGNIIHGLQDMSLKEYFEEQLNTIKSMIPMNEGDFDQSIIVEAAQNVLESLSHISEMLKQYGINIPDLDELIETLKTWIQKAIVDKEPVNNVEYAKKVAKELFEVIKHLIEAAHVQAETITTDDPLGKARVPTLSGFPLTKVPAGLLKLSGLSWITSSDLPSLIQVIATYLPATNPDDWTPPFTARAYLLGGSEIITFDGSHLSVGGDCSYVLTQDYLDGNFSVVAQFKGGKLNAIQVTDGQDVVELRHGLKPLVNGQESEFPVFKGQIRSWKRAAVVGLATKSGLKILCTPDCERCKFKVDGLYFGRLRGLLGTYNYEQFDELTLPSGEICDSADKFLAGWAIGGCSAQSPKPASREATCTKTFTDAPDFLACYHLVDAKPYRKACDSLASKESTPEGLQSAVCNVAFAYSLQCQTRIPTAVPSSCLKCAKTNTNVFETTAKVKPPFKKADVVFVVERFEENRDIFNNVIRPIIENTKKDLNAKGISDIKFGLVGFGGSQRIWPAYYTSNREILADDLENRNIDFDPQNKTPIESTLNVLGAEAGVTGKSMTYLDLVEFYPWRMGSSKVVIGVHATPCLESHSLFMLQHLYYIGSYKNKGITFHAVSPVSIAKMGTGDPNTKDLIVLKEEEYYSMEKLNQGHPNKIFKYISDACFTFAYKTGGNVFPVDVYNNGDDNIKNSFKQKLRESIVESLTSPANQHEQTCSCHPKTNPYDGIFSQPDCRVFNI